MLVVLLNSNYYQVEDASWMGLVLSTFSIVEEAFARLSRMSCIGVSELRLLIAEIA